jgi:hypothetical protein
MDLAYGTDVGWPESTGRERYRRGLYIHFQRTVPYPQLMNFDAPDATAAVCKRERSNTSLQALNLLNDPCSSRPPRHWPPGSCVRRQARRSHRASIISFSFASAAPQPPEAELATDYYRRQTGIFEKDTAAAACSVSVGRPPGRPA